MTITNNHVSHAGLSSQGHPYEQGIYTRNTTYSTISGNITDYNTCIGIRIVGGDHNLISNNTSFENFSLVETDAAGIELTGELQHHHQQPGLQQRGLRDQPVLLGWTRGFHQ